MRSMAERRLRGLLRASGKQEQELGEGVLAPRNEARSLLLETPSAFPLAPGSQERMSTVCASRELFFCATILKTAPEHCSRCRMPGQLC